MKWLAVAVVVLALGYGCFESTRHQALQREADSLAQVGVTLRSQVRRDSAVYAERVGRLTAERQRTDTVYRTRVIQAGDVSERIVRLLEDSTLADSVRSTLTDSREALTQIVAACDARIRTGDSLVAACQAHGVTLTAAFGTLDSAFTAQQDALQRAVRLARPRRWSLGLTFGYGAVWRETGPVWGPSATAGISYQIF